MKTEFDKGRDYKSIAEYGTVEWNEEDIELYHSDLEWQKEDFIEQVDKHIKFPVELKAVASNWRGQDGYAKADSSGELFSKCMSFDNDEIYLHLNDEGYYINTSSHDVPCKFNIYIKEL